MIDRAEVPRLLKSLRCELATFIAANNQRNMLFAAEAKVNGVRSAAQKYQYYEIDPTRFGVVNLSLEIQDTAGLASGTQIDRLWTGASGVTTRFLDIGPTASDQSAYTASWAFVLPQDAITLRAAPAGETRESTFSCYSQIPKRIPPPFGSAYVEDNIDALARNDFPDYALFKRVWVNNTTPLAAWLEDVGASITRATLNWHDVKQKPDQMIPAQMLYQFTVQVTGGLDAKFGLTAPAWPLVGAEVTGTVQKTNTITIYLNGIESGDWYDAQFGLTLNKDAAPLPTIETAGATHSVPTYVGRSQPRGYPEWPVIVRTPPAAPH